MSFTGIALLGVSSLTRPARASDSIRDKVARLNMRDDELAVRKKIAAVQNWSATKNNTAFQDACANNRINRELLDELHYVYVFYDKPLSLESRIRARRRLMNLYERNTMTEEEKSYILDIMNYYELLTE